MVSGRKPATEFFKNMALLLAVMLPAAIADDLQAEAEHPSLQLAQEHADAEEFEKSIKRLQEFIEKNLEHPKAPWAGVRIAQLQRKLLLAKQLETLKDSIEKAKDPPNIQAAKMAQLGSTYAALGKFDQAVKTCQTLQEHHPFTPQGLIGPFQVAALMERQEKWEEALVQYQTALAAQTFTSKSLIVTRTTIKDRDCGAA